MDLFCFRKKLRVLTREWFLTTIFLYFCFNIYDIHYTYQHYLSMIIIYIYIIHEKIIIRDWNRPRENRFDSIGRILLKSRNQNKKKLINLNSFLFFIL